MEIAGKKIGPDSPVYMIAEIGINHNGELSTAIELVDKCHEAGFDAVKFQKRTPEISTPDSQKSVLRETPWGEMTYLEYKKRIEFGHPEYRAIGEHCAGLGLTWFASPWDVPSVQFLESHDVAAYKIASASLTDGELLEAVAATRKPIILSTGMSTQAEIDLAMSRLGGCEVALMQATSTYPMVPAEANLRYISTLREQFHVPVGYSGHETGLQISIAAVALGASILERHVTLDRSMWGTDHAASLEPNGFTKLVRDVRLVESALGDGLKRVFESELGPREKLRRIK